MCYSDIPNFSLWGTTSTHYTWYRSSHASAPSLWVPTSFSSRCSSLYWWTGFTSQIRMTFQSLARSLLLLTYPPNTVVTRAHAPPFLVYMVVNGRDTSAFPIGIRLSPFVRSMPTVTGDQSKHTFRSYVEHRWCLRRWNSSIDNRSSFDRVDDWWE